MQKVPRGPWGWAAVGLALAAGMANAAAENPRKLKSDSSQEYYVYLPKDFDPGKTYWLFVGVHGLGGDGKGALGWESFADEGQCIVVGPTFKEGYQYPSRGAGDKLKAILRELAKECRFERKIFITGFSAGAQFAHRFALTNPALVAGCAAHSAGDWEDTPIITARGVLFLVTCGLDDNKNPDRIAGARAFVQKLTEKRFKVEPKWFKGVAHSFCKEARDLTREFYWTVVTGMTADQRLEADTNLLKAEELLKEGKYAEAAARLRKVTASKPSAKYAAQADAGTKKIEDAGRERLAKADEQAKTDADAAMAELMKIQDEFGGTRVATAAMQRLTALKNAANEPPKVGAPSAPKPEPPTKESEAAKAASQCRSWLEIARNLIANKKPDQALQYLWRIIDKYPDSEHAKTARKMIDEL